MHRLVPLALLLGLAACAERYSPDTYATRAVQQANKVEQGVVVGVRKVQISAEGSTGAAAGAAAGGVLGAETPGGGIGQALGGVSGALIGGLIGKATKSAAVDTPAFEYVVRTEKEDLLSVTQKDTVALAIGQKVLVITGTQARVVPDYTVATGPRPAPKDAPPAPEAPPRRSPRRRTRRRRRPQRCCGRWCRPSPARRCSSPPRRRRAPAPRCRRSPCRWRRR